MKTCAGCNQVKPNLDFRTRASAPHLLQSLCKRCESEKARAYKKTPAGAHAQSAAEAQYRRSQKGKDALKRSKQVQRERNPGRLAARVALNRALASGQMVKWPACAMPSCCETRVEAHHADYSRPLDVIWLCKKHHSAAHKAT